MEIITPRLILREFREDDFEALREIEAEPETHLYEKATPNEVETQEYLKTAILHQQETPRLYFDFAVTIPPSQRMRGLVTLKQQFEAIREWEIGWAMHPQGWGKGYATEAARQVMDWAFRERNVHRIVAFCHVLNTASVRVMEKLGMQQDGRLRETRWWNGGWSDEFVYGILERDRVGVKPRE